MDTAIIDELRSEKRLLNLRECGAVIGFSEKTVRAWVRAGKMDAFLRGSEWRIASDVLADFLEERWVKAA